MPTFVKLQLGVESMKIKEDKYYVINHVITKRKSISKILEEWLIQLKRFDLKIIYFSIVLLGFVLYTIAYVFLYGFYFGRESGDIMSIIQVIINPVPFNFKSLTILGLFLVLLLTFVIIVLQRITDSLLNKTIYIISDLVVLIILIICTQTAITLVFIGKYNLSIKYFGVWVFLILTIIYVALSLSGNVFELVYGILGGLLIFFITSLGSYILHMHIQIQIEIYSWIFIGVSLLLSILIVYYKNLKSKILYCIVYIVIYLFAIEIGEIKVTKLSLFLLAIIILILLVGINFLIKKIKKYSYIQKFIKKRDELQEGNTNLLVSGLKFVYKRYKVIFIPGIISAFILYSYFLIFDLGREISKNMLKTSYDTISYRPINTNVLPEPLRGIVVSQTDNTFYISNESKELIMIKKNSDVEIVPNKNK